MYFLVELITIIKRQSTRNTCHICLSVSAIKPHLIHIWIAVMNFLLLYLLGFSACFKETVANSEFQNEEYGEAIQGKARGPFNCNFIITRSNGNDQTLVICQLPGK